MQNKNIGSYYTPPIESITLSQINEYEQKRRNEKNELIKIGFVLGGAIMAYVIVQTLLASLLLIGKGKELFDSSPLFQSCFTMLAVHLASLLVPFGIATFILRKHIVAPLIPLKRLSASRLIAWVGCGMLMCVVSNYFVSFIIAIVKQLGYELTQGDALKPNDLLSCIAAFVGTAIVPALIEEFTMRCCSLSILKKYGKGFAMLTVSVVFGLLHGNVIQFIFAFLVGMVMAYVTLKTDSILPAMIIHACNNGTSVLSDVLCYALDKDVSATVIAIAFSTWAALGVISIIYLATKKELLPKKEELMPKREFALSFGSRFACLLPGFALPILTLVIITITTIHKI